MSEWYFSPLPPWNCPLTCSTRPPPPPPKLPRLTVIMQNHSLWNVKYIYTPLHVELIYSHPHSNGRCNMITSSNNGREVHRARNYNTYPRSFVLYAAWALYTCTCLYKVNTAIISTVVRLLIVHPTVKATPCWCVYSSGQQRRCLILYINFLLALRSIVLQVYNFTTYTQ